MTEKTYDDHISDMTGPSNERLGAISAVRGIGEDAQAELKAFMGAVTAIPGIGSEAADQMAGWRADQSVPPAFRTSQADAVREAAKITLKAHHDAAVAHANRYEQELINGMLPKRASDLNQRLLVQGEIGNILGDASGQDLVQKVAALLGQSAERDSELLGSFGESLFKGRVKPVKGVDDPHKTLRTAAVEKYLARQDGSDKQQATRKALQVYRASNALGSITAFHRAAHMYLTREDGLAPSQVQVVGVTARGRRVK